METEGRNKQRIFHKILTYGAALILCSVVALIVLQLVGVSTGQDVKNENIVLTFIGILATFIVVGNFSQVREVEERMRDDFKELKEDIAKDINRRFDIEEQRHKKDLSSAIDTFKRDDLDSIRKQIKDYEKNYKDIPKSISKEGDNLKKEYRKQFNLVLDQLVLLNGDKIVSTIIKNTLSSSDKVYKVHIKGSRKNDTIDAIAKIDDKNSIEFYKKESDGRISATPLKEINNINNNDIDMKVVNAFVSLYKLNPSIEQKDIIKGIQMPTDIDEPNVYNQTNN